MLPWKFLKWNFYSKYKSFKAKIGLSVPNWLYVLWCKPLQNKVKKYLPKSTLTFDCKIGKLSIQKSIIKKFVYICSSDKAFYQEMKLSKEIAFLKFTFYILIDLTPWYILGNFSQDFCHISWKIFYANFRRKPKL